MGELVKKIFGINLRVMRLLGFYPPQTHQRLYKIYTLSVYCMFTTLIPVLSSLYLLFDENVNLDKVADSAFIICQLGCFIVKMIPFINNEDQIRRSIYMIELPIFKKYTKEQEKIIDECAAICKRNCWSFLVFCMACIVSWGITPFFEKELKLPIDVWLPFDATSGLKIYLLGFIYVVAGAGNGALSNGAIDPLIAGLACFATSQIKILKDNLQHLSEHAEEEICNEIKDDSLEKDYLKARIIYAKIRLCIIHHNAILEFVENYQRTYSSVVFTQFGASVLVICICCLQLSKVQQLFSLPFIWMVTFLLTMLSEIFLYCYYGTMLFEENNTLTTAVYMGNWYEYDVKCRKALIILMERSKRPMIVTAGKILDLSLTTFTTILRRAYSLLAVLKNY